MCDDDFLLTYNRDCLERHSDSSDFEDNTPTNSQGNHSILRRQWSRHTMANYEKEQRCKRYKVVCGEAECTNDNHVIHPPQCTCKECITPVEEKQIYTSKKRVKYFNEEGNNNYIQTTQSRLSIVRSKIMPCLSNIFRRSHLKRDEIRKDRQIVNPTKDNCCQVYCVNCNHKRTRKSNKRNNYAVWSVYSTENLSHTSPYSGINIETPAETKDSSINCDLVSSSISTNIQTARRKFKRMIEREIGSAYLKRQLTKRTQDQQHLSRPHYKVFSTPKTSKLEYLPNDLREMNSFGCGVMPSNSSVFWEYLVDKIQRKYQTNNKNGIIKSCHCTTSTQPCPNADVDSNYLCDESGPKLDYCMTQEQATQGGGTTCSCKTSPMSQGPICLCQGQNSSPSAFNPRQKGSLQSGPGRGAPITPPRGSNTKVQCECHPNSPSSRKQNDAPVRQSGSNSHGSNRPCQEPHDQIKESLEKKYNGEVLCIHNPPCILINGCLNLPPVKNPAAQSAWPVMQTENFHCGYQPVKQNQEQASQYQPVDFQQYLLINGKKTEKITQSICNHTPPCEVVRCCHKPEYCPKLNDSCVHVPMCEKLPDCVRDSDGMSKCEHKPKCEELPLCKRKEKKYIVMSVKDNVGTQVKPNAKFECRHMPPCIMIPKCLGKLMCEGYVPYDAIPDCVHQPMCEMIPACCRKSAKMGSFFKKAYKRRKQRPLLIQYQNEN